MTRRHRLVLLATLLVPALTLATPPSSAQDGTAGGGGAPTAPEVQPPVGEVGEVHSWALAPAGSPDPDQAGNRATLSYDVDPGATVKDAVTLFNYSNVPLIFRLYSTDALNNDSGQFEVLPGKDKPTDVGTWITLPQDNIQVPAGMQVTLPVTMKVPADAKPGDHVGAVLASNASVGTDAQGTAVRLDRRTGTRLYVRVSGALHPELAVESVKTVYHPTLNPLSGTADVTYRIQNRGNVRLSGSHSVSVSGPFGLLEKSGQSAALTELLPGQGVTIHTTIEGVPASAVAFTKVHLVPAEDATGDQQATASTRTGLALAPPLSVIILGLALWLGLRSRRARRRHRDEDRSTTPPLSGDRVLEPQSS